MAGEKAVLANKPRNLIPMDTKQAGKYTTQNELRFIKGTGGEQNGNTYYRCFDWPDFSRHCTEQRPERPGLLDLKFCNPMFYNSLSLRTSEIERAVVRYFNPRANLIVPNEYKSLHRRTKKQPRTDANQCMV